MTDDVIYLGRYIWSRSKADLNITNHRIRFEDAVKVFSNPLSVEDYDDLHSEYEDRWNITGRIGETVVTVSYTLRGELIRIISAYDADSEDEEAYYENIKRFIGTR
ncbi:MAG: BrnT family toxin [Spirochaetaceae bacterium]|jgi:uncharacterized DUF497 family protein|nr:BrnT family toxin [Spirochaetaceae bacterium]